jgi:FixJ family two-component response regulator
MDVHPHHLHHRLGSIPMTVRPKRGGGFSFKPFDHDQLLTSVKAAIADASLEDNRVLSTQTAVRDAHAGARFSRPSRRGTQQAG